MLLHIFIVLKCVYMCKRNNIKRPNFIGFQLLSMKLV